MKSFNARIVLNLLALAVKDISNQIIFIGLRSSKDYHKRLEVVWVYGKGHKGVIFAWVDVC